MSIRIEGNAGAATMGGGFEWRNATFSVLAILAVAGAIAMAMSGDISNATEANASAEGVGEKPSPDPESEKHQCDICDRVFDSAYILVLHRSFDHAGDLK